MTNINEFRDKLVFSVAELNKYVKNLLEHDENLTYVFVVGEISNLVCHRTGHYYFSLKDSGGLIKSVMFKSAVSRLKFRPEDGMQVVCRGRVSLYEPSGSYQFYAEEMQPDGAGSLAVAFEQLKAKLEKEGLFDTAHKKPIPRFPKTVAIITSPTGAALQDILNILGRRFPLANIIHCPTIVQGENAAPQLCLALAELNKNMLADVIIIGRGGGSAEDLFEFNNENLAREIFASKVPVISAVGHETDFTISDFVADLRAPTPSAAAELAVPNYLDVLGLIAGYELKLKNSTENKLVLAKNRLATFANSHSLKSPEYYVEQLKNRLSICENSLTTEIEKSLKTKSHDFVNILTSLEALSPIATMKRGFSIVSNANGIVSSAKQLKPSDIIEIKFSDGASKAQIL